MICLARHHKYQMFHQCFTFFQDFFLFLNLLFSAFLYSHFRFWEPFPTVIDWPSWDLCISMEAIEEGWRNPPPTVKHNPTRSKPLKLTHFQISPPLWILTWKFGIKFFLWLSLHHFLLSFSSLSAVSSANLLSFSPSVSFHTNNSIKLASHVLVVPLIMSTKFRVYSWFTRTGLV